MRSSASGRELAALGLVDGTPAMPQPSARDRGINHLRASAGGFGCEIRDLGGSRPDPHAAGLEGFLLRLRRPRRARDDRARVAHRLAGRGGEAGDVGDDRLRHLRLDEGGGLLLVVAADLTDEDHELGLVVRLEAGEHVGEGRADDRVAADPDDRRVAEPALGQLVPDLVGERARAGDGADRPLAEDLGRDDPDVRLPGRERAGAVRPDHRDPARPDVVVDPQHLVGRQAFGDADDRADPRVDGFVDRVRREAGGDEDHRRVRAGLGDSVGDRVEDGDAVDVLAAFAGGHAGDHLRPVGAVAEAVEAALTPGQPLHDQPRVPVDDDRHYRFLALSKIFASRITPPSIRWARSSRTRSASSPSQPVRASHASSGCSLSTKVTFSTSRPAAARKLRHSSSPYERTWVGSCKRSASSTTSLSYSVSSTRTSSRLTPAISRVAAPTSSKWCAAMRVTTTSKDPSANGSSSARQITSGSIPGAGSQLTTRQPASRSLLATWPPPVATSSAARAGPGSAHSTMRSRSSPSR